MNKYFFVSALKSAMKKNDHKQVDVAKLVGLNQSQVSKILNKRFRKDDVDAINRLKIYSNYNEYLDKHQLTGEIDKAVSEVWDGSLEMERRLANIIRRVGPELLLPD